MKNFFKKLSFVLALAMIVTAIAPAAKTSAAAAPSYKYNKKVLYIGGDATGNYGETHKFPINNAKGYTVTWKSSKKSVATVDAKSGKVQAVGVGTSVITATATSKTGKATTLEAKVFVKQNGEKVGFGSLAKVSAMKVGDSVKVNVYRQLDAKKYWTQADKTVVTDYIKWESSNTAVATVSKWGTVTAVAAGEAVITAKMMQTEGSTVVDSANFPVKVASAGLTVESVKAVTTTTVEVKFDKVVDAVAAANFVIEGVAVNAASLNTDGMTVVLTTAPLTPKKSYDLKVTGVKINAIVQADVTVALAVGAVDQLFNPTLVASPGTIKADGASQAIVSFSLKDALGNVITNAKDVEVAFSTTFGQFAQNRVALQNGQANLLLTSEYLTADKVAELRAIVIEAQDANLIGLKAETSVIMAPNPETIDDEKLGASMTGAESNQADRVIVYFNKSVTVDQYINATTKVIDTTKLDLLVKEGSTGDLTGTPVAVRGLLPVAGNSKALQIMLDVETNPANALTDNANVYVAFTDKTGTVPVARTATFKLTDARKPAMLSVANEGLKKLVLTFSEAVDEATAETEANWLIDGIVIDNVKYNATAEVGQYDVLKGIDQRHIVTITLGVGKYLTSGSHSVQASNILDWAGLTDAIDNKMNTQTLDFTIAADNNKPEATVEVMSPEQWLVTYNRDVEETAAVFAPKLTLQTYNTTTGTWVADTMNANILVTKIDGNKFLVETTRDWTDRHNTLVNNKNYFNFNYRLDIAVNAATNVSNGLKSDAQQLTLAGAMTTPDLTSPVIADIVEVTAGTAYKAVMSEPVKMSGAANLEGVTLAQAQTALPVVTAQFIKADNTQTVDGTVGAAFVNDYDKELTVTPVKTLEPGSWILVVRSISDDVGNTAASANKLFTVTGTPTAATTFKVLFSFADTDADKVVENVDAVEAADGLDYVFVKFSKPVSVSGGTANALATTNYTLNGQALPLGTQIVANITGYDDLDNVIDSVTIKLPENTLGDKNTPHVINISTNLKSAEGEALTNGGEKVLPYEATTGDLLLFDDDLVVYTSVAAVKTALDTITGGVSTAAQFDAFETAYETAVVAIATLDNEITVDADKSHVATAYTGVIDAYKAAAKADAEFAFVVTAADATHVSVKLAGTAVNAISVATEYTVEYNVALGTRFDIDLTDLAGVAVTAADAAADTTVMTVTDVFWAVSDTVTITTDVANAVTVSAN